MAAQQPAAEENQRAQAEYYRVQAAKTRDDLSDRWKKLSDKVTLGAALAAAIVSLLSLYVSLRTQRDTQFYEALKRFGDKSPRVRLSATRLLAQMARTSRHTIPVIDQLVAGIALESDRTVLRAIRDAIPVVTDRSKHAKHAISSLLAISEPLQRQIAQSYVDFLVTWGVTGAPGIGGDEFPIPEMDKWFQDATDRAEQITSVKRKQIIEMTIKWFGGASSDATALLRSALVSVPANDQQRIRQQAKVESSLEIAGERLRTYFDTLTAVGGKDEDLPSRDGLLFDSKLERRRSGDHPLRQFSDKRLKAGPRP